MARPIMTDPKKILAAETGTIRKDPRGRIQVALVYPNTYSVGMSNLGFQTLYGLLNNMDNLLCERAFLPQMGKGVSVTGPKTLESNRLLSEFDVIAFSISFENDYPNILAILDGASIPLQAVERTRRHPLILAGGVACFINPEPIADFVDCFIIGEAEPVIDRFFEIFDPSEARTSNLEKLEKEVEGVYVPAFYEMSHDATQTSSDLTSPIHGPSKIQRVYAKDLSSIQTTSSILTSQTSFGDTFLIETGRGCPHGCRFCSAGYVYRPLRFRKLDQLAESLAQGMAMTSRIGLVGAAITDLPDLKPLCEYTYDKDIRLSFSSLRADRLSDEVISVLQKSQVKTATIAPDAGSERMRSVIKKGITEEDILAATQRLVAADIPNLKLYFMVGLPTETLGDVRDIVVLCQKIKQTFLDASRLKKRIGTITVSINPFVPKPFTPFQWAAMDDLKTVKQKIKLVRNGLKAIPNVRVITESPRQSFIQGLLSRGDRGVGQLLLKFHQNRRDWGKTLKDNPILSERDVLRSRSFDENLPWQFIDQGFGIDLLKREYEKALSI